MLSDPEGLGLGFKALVALLGVSRGLSKYTSYTYNYNQIVC